MPNVCNDFCSQFLNTEFHRAHVFCLHLNNKISSNFHLNWYVQPTKITGFSHFFCACVIWSNKNYSCCVHKTSERWKKKRWRGTNVVAVVNDEEAVDVHFQIAWILTADYLFVACKFDKLFESELESRMCCMLRVNLIRDEIEFKAKRTGGAEDWIEDFQLEVDVCVCGDTVLALQALIDFFKTLRFVQTTISMCRCL